MDQENCARLPNSKGGRSGSLMTLELCDALCVGFQYFSVQSGQYCNCGQAYGTQGNTSQESWCNQRCTGDKSQTCGGNRRGFHSASSVYRRHPHTPLEQRGGDRPDGLRAHVISPTTRGGGGLGQSRKPARLTTSTVGNPQPHCHLIPACRAPNASVDWTSKGLVVGDVPDQGACNASWAFAAAAAVESASAMVTGKLVPLSAQGIIDCGWKFGGQSCKGGDVGVGFMYAQNVGLCTESSNPFTGNNAACCRSNCNLGVPCQEDGGVQGFCNVPAASETALMSALSHQPVAVGLALPPGFLHSYKGGIFEEDYQGPMNEAALAVGYGTLHGQKYWKVKLFRGRHFGLSGYALLARGGDTGPLGMCSILAAPSYPVVTKPPKTYPKPEKRHRYGSPPCMQNEQQVQVPGTSNTICTTRCTTGGSCPNPGGHADASPSCDLDDPKSKHTFCTLNCQGDCDCPPAQQCVMSVYLASPICVPIASGAE
jgi:hypothetical protein